VIGLKISHSKYTMTKINIKIYTEVYRQHIASLIEDIQKNKFGIPAKTDEQLRFGKTYQEVYQIMEIFG
jgi:hypothetical protein